LHGLGRGWPLPLDHIITSVDKKVDLAWNVKLRLDDVRCLVWLCACVCVCGVCVCVCVCVEKHQHRLT
jgi:hypothetical protein